MKLLSGSIAIMALLILYSSLWSMDRESAPELKSLLFGEILPSNEIVDKYLKNGDEAERRNGYAAIAEVARISSSTEKRQVFIEYLIDGLYDESLSILTEIKSWLQDFGEPDFSSHARERLDGYIAAKGFDREIILIAGKAHISPIIPELRVMANSEIMEPEVGRWYGTIEWASLLVLARFSEKGMAARVIQRVEQEKNPVFRATDGLKDVAYICQPEGIELLRKYLNSNERLPGVKDNDSGELVCKRAAALLAESLIDFPMKKQYFGDFTETDIDVCRQWMNAHKGEWKIKR
jgi:hypothetical protein